MQSNFSDENITFGFTSSPCMQPIPNDYDRISDEQLHDFEIEHMNEWQGSRKAYGKGIKRDITRDEMPSRKKFKESDTLFDFNELSKELNEIDLNSKIYPKSNASADSVQDASMSSEPSDEVQEIPGVYYSLNNSCIKELCYEFGFRPIVLPEACSTRLNSTDLEILNISSASFQLTNQRRITM